jgi:signal transduction histidine kinase
MIFRTSIFEKSCNAKIPDVPSLLQAPMTDRPYPQPMTARSPSESLQCLTHFLRDIGRITNIPAIAERIVTGLSEIARCPKGSLYLAEHEGADFRRLTAQGPAQMESAPPTLALNHPLVRLLTQHRQILDRSVYGGAGAHSTPDMPPSLLKNFCCSAAIPLINRGRLVAFALLQSEPASDGSVPENVELLTAMAQSAATALDSLLVYEDFRQSQTLMRRTDRLRSLETIAGGFAHEIRNPLTSIKTFIELTPERKDDVEFIRDFSPVVLDDVHRIERLIQEILDYARYMEPRLTEEDMNDIVLSCLYFIDVKARSRGMKIEKELAPELPPVMLDRQQFKQVLLNLFLNAMDAIGGPGGTIRVSTTRVMKQDGHIWVQIEVEDTGHGIPASNLEHIFDPFFTTKHESGENEGTGLGLTIVHQIIREHQGTIHVQSTEGVGTTFRINLPSIV